MYQRRMAKARVVGVTGGAPAPQARYPWLWRAAWRARDGLSTGDVVELQGTEAKRSDRDLGRDIPYRGAHLHADTASKLDASLIASRSNAPSCAGRDRPRGKRRLTACATGRRPGARRRHRPLRYRRVVRLDGAAIATWLPRLANPLGKLPNARVSARLRTAPRSRRHGEARTALRHATARVAGGSRNGVVMVVDLAHGQKPAPSSISATTARASASSRRAARAPSLQLRRRLFDSGRAGRRDPRHLGRPRPSGASRTPSARCANASTRGAMPSSPRTPLHSSKPRKPRATLDLVVSDPPSFVRARRPNRGRFRLTASCRRGGRVLAPGGVLCARHAPAM